MRKLILVSIIGFGVLFAKKANSQSLKTAVDYIIERLPECVFPSNEKSRLEASKGNNNCSLFIKNPQYSTTTMSYSFRFSSLDANKILIKDMGGYYLLTLRTLQEKDKITRQINGNIQMTRVFYLRSRYGEVLRRLKKAFIVAINKCTARDPFKD